MVKFLRNLFLGKLVYLSLGAIFSVFILAFFIPAISIIPRVALLVLLLILLLDILVLFMGGKKMKAVRISPERMSNGDRNEFSIRITSLYNLPIIVSLIEELPFDFQKRDFEENIYLKPGGEKTITYFLQPVHRGDYSFGNTILMVNSPLQFITRRFEIETAISIPCYPSFKKLSRFSIKGIALEQSQIGARQVRKLGHSTEFEQIKEYVKGDDIRKINWKASARKNQLMVNSFIDERSQQIYCIINKGRVMQMPFNGMSLLDHSINASLVLTNVAITRSDKAGLITFNNKINTFLPADSKRTQLNLVMNLLYKEETNFLESDFENLYSIVKNKITHRSLLILFTNFETESALERELPYLKKLSAHHLLLVVFFENTEIKKLIEDDVNTLENLYTKTIAEKFSFEKRKMVRELNNNGIAAVLTTPEKLSVDTVNKYVELKMRRAI